MNDQIEEMWNVSLELKQTITAERADILMDALAAYGVAVGSGPHNRVTVILSLPATDLLQAVMPAVAVTERASGSHVVAIGDVMPTEDFHARSGLEPIPALASVSEAAEILGVSKPRVNQMISEG